MRIYRFVEDLRSIENFVEKIQLLKKKNNRDYDFRESELLLRVRSGSENRSFQFK